MESIRLGDFEEVLSLTLITNLTNASEIKKMALSGETNVVLVNPEMVADIFQVYVAAHKGLFNYKKECMITKSLQSEILFSFSSSKNISSSFKKFGISDNHDKVLLVQVHLPGENSIPKLLESIKGTQTPLTELSNFSNISEIKKAYGIKEKELTCSSLIDSIVTKISTREFI